MIKLEDKYQDMTEEERQEERRKLEAWDELRERGPSSYAPLAGYEPENEAYKV